MGRQSTTGKLAAVTVRQSIYKTNNKLDYSSSLADVIQGTLIDLWILQLQV